MSSVFSCGRPAGISSQSHWEVGDHSPDDSLSEGEGQPLQEGGEGKGEGVEEEHAPLLPEYRQALALHSTHTTIEYMVNWPLPSVSDSVSCLLHASSCSQRTSAAECHRTSAAGNALPAKLNMHGHMTSFTLQDRLLTWSLNSRSAARQGGPFQVVCPVLVQRPAVEPQSNHNKGKSEALVGSPTWTALQCR